MKKLFQNISKRYILKNFMCLSEVTIPFLLHFCAIQAIPHVQLFPMPVLYLMCSHILFAFDVSSDSRWSVTSSFEHSNSTGQPWVSSWYYFHQVVMSSRSGMGYRTLYTALQYEIWKSMWVVMINCEFSLPHLLITNH